MLEFLLSAQAKEMSDVEVAQKLGVPLTVVQTVRGTRMFRLAEERVGAEKEEGTEDG